MKLSDFTWLADRNQGLELHLIPFAVGTEALCEEIRGLFVRMMIDYGYTGYDYGIDNPFHSRAAYLAVSHPRAGIIMTSRINPPVDGLVSFELGLRANGSLYRRTSEEPVLDLTTYTYLRGYYQSAWRLQCAGLCRFISLSGARRSFCLYDLENTRTERAYSEFGFVPSELFPEPIHFPTFERFDGKTRRPIWWRIMEWSSASIETHAERAVALQVASPHPLVDFSLGFRLAKSS